MEIEKSLQLVVSVVHDGVSPNSFTVRVGLETIGRVFPSGLTETLGRWIWTPPSTKVHGMSVSAQRGSGDFDTRMEAVWALLADRFKTAVAA